MTKPLLLQSIQRPFILPARLLCFVLALQTDILACGSIQDTHRREAREFCKLHNPEHWREFSKSASPVELQTALKAKINSVVKTKAFRQIITELEQVRILRALYTTAQSKISQLTGESWNCPDYIAFYSVSFLGMHKENEPEEIIEGNVIVGVDENGH